MKLLVVDDSNLIRTRISTVGASNQMKGLLEVVGTAHDGLEAVRMAARFRPEIVTMDLTMPGMDGVATIGALMKMAPAPSILVVSALNDKSTAIAALRLGARGFLTKPFTDDELRLALFEVMDIQSE